MVLFIAVTYITVYMTSIHAIRKVLLVLPLAALVLGMAHWRVHRQGEKVVLPVGLLAFLGWSVASYTWSTDRHDSAHQILEWIGIALTGVIAAIVLRREELLRAFSLGSKLLIVMTGTALVVAYHAASAPPVIDPAPGWHGPIGGKNILGLLMALAIILFAAEMKTVRSDRWWILAAVVLLLGSQSGAGLCITLLVVAIWAWEWGLKGVTNRINRVMFKIISILLAAAGALFLLTDFPAATSLFGKSSTLTGRTHIWSAVITAIKQKPTFGYGFAGVWFEKTGPTAVIWKHIGFTAYEAHDLYLDIWLQLGLVGIALFVVVAVMAALRLLPAVRQKDPGFRWITLIFMALLIEGIVESDLLSAEILLFAAAVTASAIPRSRLGGRSRPLVSRTGSRTRTNFRVSRPRMKLKANSFLRAASWGSAFQVVNAASSGFMFLVLARDLGPTGFGFFAAVAGVTGLISTVVNGWIGFVITENIIRDHELPEITVASVNSWLAIGAALSLGITAAIANLLVPHVPTTTTLVYLSASVLGASAMGMGASTVQSIKGYATSVRLPLLQQGVLLVALVVLWLNHAVTLLSVGLVMLFSATVLGLIAVAWASTSCSVRFRFGRPRIADLRRGSFYAVTLLCFATEEDVDKPLLVRFGFTHTAGLYSAAYNIVTIGLMPLDAVTAATHNRFLEHNPEAKGQHSKRSIQVTMFSGAYGLIATVTLWFAAPLVPDVLGQTYRGTSDMIRLLAVLILFRSLTVFASNGLMGLGKRVWRTMSLVVAALVNVVLNVTLIPSLSWKGAVIATIGGETCFMVLTWAGLLRYQRAHDAEVSRAQPPPDPAHQVSLLP